MERLIAYFRVSTKKQGDSGLGLAAQKAAVEAYALRAGANIDASFTEVESGKLADRPKLAAALAQARRSGAKLVIAKLDRLARNVAFLSALMDSGTEFVACDNQNANRLTLHILSAVAEDEAMRISQRTKAALAAAKAAGTLLGSARPGHWAGREQARVDGAKLGAKRSAIVRHANSLAAVADLLPAIQVQRDAGDSLRAIAKSLNNAGQTTVRGKVWTAQAVKLVLDRANEKVIK